MQTLRLPLVPPCGESAQVSQPEVSEVEAVGEGEVMSRSLDEFKAGDEDRKTAIVIAASDCVRHARRDLLGAMGKADKEAVTVTLSQNRFNPVFQRQLVEAVDDWLNYITGSGPYKLSDKERREGLQKLADEGDAQPWIKEELERLTLKESK